MPVKTKTILLAGPLVAGDDRMGSPTHYRVIKITDTSDINPGQIVDKRKADDLCAAHDWKVTFVTLESTRK